MSWPKTAAVILVTLVLQVCLFSRFSYEGARPDVMIALAVTAGFVCGPDRGAIVAFAAGLSFDVVLTTPFGLSALVYTVIGYVVGTLASNVVRAAWWISPAVVAVGSAAGVFFYALVAQVLGQSSFSGTPLSTVVVVVALVNAAISPLMVRALRWARADETDPRRYASFAR